MTQKIAIFVFRRDFRLHDNLGLLRALKENVKVFPVFILDPKQIDGREHYTSAHFMVESLQSLNSQLRKASSSLAKLHILYAPVLKALDILCNEFTFTAVYVNRDYTPYSASRDREMQAWCSERNIAFVSTESELLYPLGTICKKDGSGYSIYTPFAKKAAMRVKVKRPIENRYKNYGKVTNPSTRLQENMQKAQSILKKIMLSSEKRFRIAKGGRELAIARLRILKRKGRGLRYDDNRDMLTYDTSSLSPYLRFGCISPREAWHYIKQFTGTKKLLAQLLWREFYYNVAAQNPKTVFSSYSMNPAFRKLPWRGTASALARWQRGETGFPVVDAAMRQLVATGFMHNRARLIAGSFLVKVLNVNWIEGERFFGEHLTDYDLTLNTLNWQWVAGTGTDSQPWFRSFNPWLQGEKFDPEARYIKRWVPELRNVKDISHIHHWDRFYAEEQRKGVAYQKPMCTYQVEVAKTIEQYRRTLHKGRKLRA